MERTLYHFPLDPASRQARLALGEKRLAAIGVLPYVAARITPEVLKQFNGIFLTVVERPEGAAGEGIGVSAQILDHVEFERTADRPSAATDDEPIG